MGKRTRIRMGTRKGARLESCPFQSRKIQQNHYGRSIIGKRRRREMSKDGSIEIMG